MADIITGNTQLGPTKADIIAALVQKELKAAAKLLTTVSDVSSFATKGAKSISFPKLTSFVVQNRASGVPGDIQTLQSAVDKLDLNFNAYVSWLIDSSDLMQSTIEAQSEFASRAATAHARYVDENIVAELEASYFNTSVGGPITLTKVLDLRKALLANNADINNMYLVLSIEEEANMLAIPEFVRADAYGNSNIPSGVIGRIYGVSVVVSNTLVAGAFMYDKAGVAIGFQLAPSYAEQPAIAYGTNAKLSAIDQLFGIQAMQLGVNGAAPTKSPLIAKM